MRVCYVSSETEAMLTQCTVPDERDNFEIIYFNYTFILTFRFKTIVISILESKVYAIYFLALFHCCKHVRLSDVIFHL